VEAEVTEAQVLLAQVPAFVASLSAVYEHPFSSQIV